MKSQLLHTSDLSHQVKVRLGLSKVKLVMQDRHFDQILSTLLLDSATKMPEKDKKRL